MSRVIDSFKDSIVLLKNNKSIFGIVFLWGIIGLVFESKYVDNLLDFSSYSKIDWVFLVILLIILISIYLFLFVGTIGLVKNIIEGNPGFKNFKIESRKHFIPVLKGTLILLAYFGLTFIVYFKILFVYFLKYFIRSEFFFKNINYASLGMLVSMSIFIGYLMVFVFLPFFVFQFFIAGIIVKNHGVVESFKKSYNFVWSRKLSVLGFFIIHSTLNSLAPSTSKILVLTGSSTVHPLIKTIDVLLVLFWWTIFTSLYITYFTVYYIQAKRDDYKTKELVVRTKRSKIKDILVFFLILSCLSVVGAVAKLGRVGDYSEKIYEKTEAIEDEPTNYLNYLTRGITYLKEGEYDRAISDFDKAIELEPRSTGAYLDRARAYSEMGDYDKAIADYDKAIEINPNIKNAYNNRGEIYEKLGESKKAQSDFDKAASFENSQLQDELVSKTYSLLEKGNYVEAIATANMVLETYPNNLKALIGKARALHYLDRFEESLEVFDKALEINPNDAVTLEEKGYTLEILGKHLDSLFALDKSIKIDPNSNTVWAIKGRVLYKLVEYEKSLLAFDKALEIDPNDAYSWHEKGYVLNLLGRYEESIEASNKAIELNPYRATSWNNIGYALIKLGRDEEADEAFDNAGGLLNTPQSPTFNKMDKLRDGLNEL